MAKPSHERKICTGRMMSPKRLGFMIQDQLREFAPSCCGEECRGETRQVGSVERNGNVFGSGGRRWRGGDDVGVGADLQGRENGDKELRGGDKRVKKEKLIARCEKVDPPTYYSPPDVPSIRIPSLVSHSPFPNESASSSSLRLVSTGSTFSTPIAIPT